MSSSYEEYLRQTRIEDPLAATPTGPGMGIAGVIGYVGGEDVWDPLTQAGEFAEAIGMDPSDPDFSEIQEKYRDILQREEERFWRFQCPFCKKLFSQARWARHEKTKQYQKRVGSLERRGEEVPRPQFLQDPHAIKKWLKKEGRRLRAEREATHAVRERRRRALAKRAEAARQEVKAKERKVREEARAEPRRPLGLSEAMRELQEAREALAALESEVAQVRSALGV